MDDRPLLAITLGDPAGIGPEVSLKAAADPAIRELACCLLIGPAAVARQVARDLGLSGEGAAALESVDVPVRARVRSGIAILDVGQIEPGMISPGQLSAAAGWAGVAAIETAAQLALAGDVDGIVTAPLNKEAMRLAGVPYPGHTEMLAALTGARRATMLLLSGSLRVVHVSVHVSLREAIERVRRDAVREAIEIALEAGAELGIPAPRVAVAGLNPHAGEGGLFGREDQEEIAPAVEEMRAAGNRVMGPLPADTVFLRARQGEFDFVVAMYHDQGHIAVKMLGLETGVNVTLGLPIVRTSVDHGTAFDIAGRGVARHESMAAAIRIAAQMVIARRARELAKA